MNFVLFFRILLAMGKEELKLPEILPSPGKCSVHHHKQLEIKVELPYLVS